MTTQNMSPPPLLSCSTNYRAFVSFTDEDTHMINFLHHLLKQLSLNGIHTDVKNGIDEARFLVVFLSERYVSSAQCLDQLVKIVDVWELNGEQVLVPIFCNVDPADVRDQAGVVADVFAVHEMNFKEVQRWRDALTKVASICGWDSRDWEDEVLVKEIVRDISDRLFYRLSKDTGDLVGICSYIKEMEKHMCCGGSDVAHMVGIWGMGGIGKTTIAKVIYDMLSSKFQLHCFLENVKDNFSKHGAAFLQQQLLSTISSGRRNFSAGAYNVGLSVIKRKFCRTKVLLVLDDVDDWKQLEALAGEHNWFGSGSKIIITTRDKHLLKAHGVQDIYEVKCLQTDAALQLFSQYAFRQKNPKMEYLKLSRRLISYAQGLPLALKVLGSSLYETSIIEWQKVQDKLEKLPDLRIHDVLKVSFDGLDDLQREVFLDIACFFNEEYIEVARNTLEACGFFPDIAFAVLKDKALITIKDGELNMHMHDLLQEMGHDIVRQESEEPGKRSRLWIPEDIHQVLTKNTGTRSVEAISLNMSRSRDMHLEGNVFAGMSRLRLLDFYVSKTNQKQLTDNKVHFDQDLQYLPSELRYLHWHKFPSKSLPLNFNAGNLVKLKLFNSNVKQLWGGVQSLANLKEIDLACCKYLTAIPDLSNAKSIKTINLAHCKSLIELPSSIQQLNNLEKINLGNCESLIYLPDRIDSKCLREATFTHCSKLKKCPEIFGNLKRLDLSYTGISELPKSIQELNVLEFLDLQGCSNITKFPNVSPNTRVLYLMQNAIEEVPSSIQFLTGLVALKLSGNKKLTSLPSCIWKLKSLASLDLSGCSKLENFPEILEPAEELTYLNLSGTAIKVLSSTIEHLKSLSKLFLVNCKKLVSLPCNIRKLSTLRLIDLSYCIKLCALPQFPESIKYLAADQCESLETLSTKWESYLDILHFVNCFNLDGKEEFQVAIQLMAIKATKSEVGTRFLFPGKQIPKWFADQSTGSSVTVQLPLSWNVLKGIVVCIVYELGEPPSLAGFISPSEYWIRCKCFITRADESCEDEDVRDIIWDRRWFDADIHLAKSDHVLMWSHPYTESTEDEEWLKKYSGKEACFEFCFETDSELLNISKFMVKKCGVVLLYGDEDETILRPDKCLASDDEQHELPQPKRPKLSDVVM